MIVALDYDGTFSRDPEKWLRVVEVLTAGGGVEVVGITARSAEMGVPDPRYAEACSRVIYADLAPKREFALAAGVDVDVWIDDKPEYIGPRPRRRVRRRR